RQGRGLAALARQRHGAGRSRRRRQIPAGARAGGFGTAIPRARCEGKRRRAVTPPVFAWHQLNPNGGIACRYGIFFTGLGSSPNTLAAVPPRMLRRPVSLKNGRSEITLGRSKSQCG